MTTEQAKAFLMTRSKCRKGACIAPATRFASFHNREGKIVEDGNCCDAHGGDPSYDLPNAGHVRLAAAIIEEDGGQWWHDGCYRAVEIDGIKLKSGRRIPDVESLTAHGDGELAEGYDNTVDGIDRQNPLTKEEKREIADAVIAHWEGWAKS